MYDDPRRVLFACLPIGIEQIIASFCDAVSQDFLPFFGGAAYGFFQDGVEVVFSDWWVSFGLVDDEGCEESSYVGGVDPDIGDFGSSVHGIDRQL